VSAASWMDTAYVGVLPDFARFKAEFRKGVDQALRDAQQRVARGGDRIEREVEDSFRDAARGADRQLRKIGGPGTFTGLERQADRAADRVERDMRRAQTSSSRHFGLLKVGILGAAGGLVGALGAVGIAAGKAGLETAASMEQAQVSFSELLGSAKEADRFLRDLTRFAAKTPFELPGVVAASRQLLGAGLNAKQTMTALEALGNATGALGLNQEQFGRVLQATSQMLNKGKVSTEELLQISEAGLPIFPMLAKAMGVTTAELQRQIQTGKVQADEVLPKLFAQMQKDYGGAMERQSRTLNGVWSTFKDTINIGVAGALSGLADWLKVILPRAAQAFQDAAKAIERFIREELLPRLGGLKQAWDDNKDAIMGLVGVGPAAQQSLGETGDAAASLTDTLTTVVTTLGQVSRALGVMGDALNRADEIADTVGHSIHVNFFRPLYASIGTLVGRWVAAFHLMLRVAATAAEAMHLPWARSLRKAEQDVGHFKDTYNREVKALKDEQTKITAKFGWQGLQVFRVGGPRGAFAGGGQVDGPGTSTSDSIDVRLSKGEHVWTAREVTGAGGHRQVERMRRRAVGRYAGGGPVGARLAGGGPSLTAALELPAPDELRGSLARFRRRIGQVLDDVTAAFRRELRRTGLGTLGGGGMAGWIAQAIALTGVPISWAPALHRRAMFESGGNPRAVNLWDVNAQRGTPSMGLMQTIGPTFAAYKLDGLSDIFNPVHNLVAAIRYILSRYGSIFAIDPPVRGYDRGGLLRPGQAGVNRSGRTERVLSPEQTAAYGRPAFVGVAGDLHVHAPGGDAAGIRTAVLEVFEVLFDEWRRGAVA
jgi:tape measure domain-containing protein